MAFGLKASSCDPLKLYIGSFVMDNIITCTYVYAPHVLPNM